jgi:hypothetical protein
MVDWNDNTRQSVADAIKRLAMSCDHAQARDAVGFSKATAGPGHEIAALGTERWGDDIWRYAGKLAAHHARQLRKRKHIDDGELETLLAAGGPGGLRSPAIKADWIDSAYIDGRLMVVACFGPRHADVSDRLRRLALPPQDVYQPAGAGRLWRIAEPYAFLVADVLDRLDMFDEDVLAIVQRSLDAASVEDRLLAHRGPVVRCDADTGALTFKSGYEQRVIDAMKATKGGGFTVGLSWKDVTYEIYAHDAGHRLFQQLLEMDLSILLTEEARDALAAIKGRSAPVTRQAHVTFENGTLSIWTAKPNPAWLVPIRLAPGRRWTGAVWTVPKEAIGALLEEADRMGVSDLAQAVRTALPAVDPGLDALPGVSR